MFVALKNLDIYLLSGILTFLPFYSMGQLSKGGERFQDKYGEICIHPIEHASMVIEWNNMTIYIDPVGGAEPYAAFPDPDLLLITHVHPDHMNSRTLRALNLKLTTLIAPENVAAKLKSINFSSINILKNGEKTTHKGVSIEGVAMYNVPDSEDAHHPKGVGNGYILTLGKKRLYISGDSGPTPEMQNLKNIHIAFICMNLPYTMDVPSAASAVLKFKPKIVYPYHYRNGDKSFSDVKEFKTLVGKSNPALEVRLLEWYPD